MEKPIDWSKVKSGDGFTAEIRNTICKGKIYKGKKRIFLCQNEMMGLPCSNYHGYAYSWTINQGSLEDMETCEVTNLKIISQSKIKLMAKKKAETTIEKIKTLTGANWHIAKEKSGLSTKLVSRNGKVNRYDKGFNNRQNALLNITSSIRNGFIDDGIFIEAMIAAKTRQDVVDAINAYGYLKPKRVAAKKKKTELIAGVTVKNGKRVDAVKVVKKKSGKVKK